MAFDFFYNFVCEIFKCHSFIVIISLGRRISPSLKLITTTWIMLLTAAYYAKHCEKANYAIIKDSWSTHTQLFHGSLDFVRDSPGEPVSEETFTHLHLSWSSIIPYLLRPSTAIHRILPVQSTCLTVFFPQSLSKFSFVYLLAWHSLLHTPYISLPNHCLLFAAYTHTIATCFAVISRLCHLILVSFSSLYLELYLVAECRTSIWPFSSLPAIVDL